jgi:heat shock protein HslJ
MCYPLRMRSGCRLLLVASVCAFIAAPVPAQENTKQPIHKPTSLEFFSIENRRWRIAKYRADDGQQTDKDGLIDAWRTAEVTFLGGNVYGSPTCGAWGGTYKLSGRRMAVDADVSLLGFCPPEMWSQSLAVVKAFKGELSIEKAGDEILLLGQDGRARVRLVPIGLPLPIGFPPSGPTK